jgi:hypothetical protein
MKIERVWAMPNKKTFTIKPIRDLIVTEFNGEENYLDPFPFEYSKDATVYLNEATVHKYGVFDPPYSPTQLKRSYKGLGEYDTKQSTWSKWKNLMASKVSDKCISFGWNTSGLGKARGFEITKILLVCHGAGHNDTICTVEEKINESSSSV